MVKITALKTLQLDNVGDGCLIRIETDSGLVGYGESGINSKLARRIETIQQTLIGQDPKELVARVSAPLWRIEKPLDFPSGGRAHMQASRDPDVIFTERRAQIRRLSETNTVRRREPTESAPR
ncbi:MAG TPA: hypothetical protein VNY05_09830 [Candidatus Acidoferrales bacterium]|jgi:L-alanine-DL-glutamate epimerase-like enolase superfamily enzyme|nr:hypothetical protein [Candidatus Acidoferrales bacterium]